MGTHNPVGNRQSKPGPLYRRLGGEERFKNSSDMLRCNSRTAVFHAAPDLGLARGCPDGQASSFLCLGVSGIDGQVDEHLPDLVLNRGNKERPIHSGWMAG